MRKIICLLSVILLLLGVSTTASCGSDKKDEKSKENISREIENKIANALINLMPVSDIPASVQLGYIVKLTESEEAVTVIVFRKNNDGTQVNEPLTIILKDFLFDELKYNELYNQYINDGRTYREYGRKFEDSRSYIDYYYNAVFKGKYNVAWQNYKFTQGFFYYTNIYAIDDSAPAMLINEVVVRSKFSLIEISEYNINKILHDYKEEMGWLL